MTKTMIVWFALVVAACGGEGDGADPEPLTCQSIALCTTYDTKVFIGKVPAPEGGSVRDGLYRLAWAMDPDNIDEDPSYDDLDALEIRGQYFNWAGSFRDNIGAIATAGTTMTFKKSQLCERGSDGSSSTDSLEYKYTATGNELRLFSHIRRSDGVEWDRMKVYVLTSSPADVCKTVSSEPSAPGDSAICRVTNCACKFAVEGTVSTCT